VRPVSTAELNVKGVFIFSLYQHFPTGQTDTRYRV